MSFARTALLMAVMTALFLFFGFLLAGETGMGLALVVAAGMNIFAYWNSDQMVLRMHGARRVEHGQAPELVGIVENLATRAGLPVPAVYIIDSAQPNAFATGRNPENAAVAASAGLLKCLNRQEIEGVMAHELAHIKNRDTLIMTITATIAGAISMLANFALFFGGNRNNPLGIVGTILMMILAPLAAMLVQMAISRTREYAADKMGAEISGNPLALASALTKLQRGAITTENPRAEASPATAHMFIVNPLHGRSFDSLFSTHPKMEGRIRRLKAMVGTIRPRPASSPISTAVRTRSARDTAGSWTQNKPRSQAAKRGGTSVPDSGKHHKPKGPWG